MFSFGDWVVYDPGDKQEIGRVTECRDKSVFVCYTQGCTAASTPLEYLRPATRAEVEKASAGIGFHRFDKTCPERVEEACGHCRAVKA